ncbi:hypothetical protein HII31_05904, partial [Pseudocercospora fuligena]
MSSKQTRPSRGRKSAGTAATTYRRDYDVAGLRDLVQQRTGLTPAKGKSKKFYIGILVQDDAMKAANAAAGDKTFPFLDLPAELRNDIYHQLLVAEPNPVTGRTAGHPEILRTCKQIHEEATGILYNKHTLKLEFRAGRKGGLKRDVRTTCSQTVMTFHSSRASKLSDFLDWPMHLFRIRSLDIDLELGTTQEVVLMATNHALFGLGDRLAHHGAIKQLDVFCHICP